MRKSLLSACLLLMGMNIQAQSFETAAQAVEHMGIGWNLGNTLDAHDGNLCPDIVKSETMWGQPVTRPELMAMMKEAGFMTIRVPVTWYPHMDENGKVDEVWMQRVHEVVDYVIDQGMYCVLNVHHDTGDGPQWLHASMEVYETQKSRFEYLWTQIAEEFRDYDHYLLFEAYNEMLDKYNSWCFASFARTGGYNAADASDAYQAINSYAQSFVDAVRATGGNNSQRNLVVNTYAATCGSGTWNAHLADPLKEMALPDDPAGSGHIAFEVHCYPSIFKDDNSIRPMSEIKTEVNQAVSRINSHLVGKGAPVIIGEWAGTYVNKTEQNYEQRHQHLIDFVDFFVKTMKDNHIATIEWMGLSDGAFRSDPVFSQPDLAAAIAKAYHGDDYEGLWPSLDDRTEYVAFEGDKTLYWGKGIHIGAAIFAAMDKTLQLHLTYASNGQLNDCIQLYDGNWGEKTPFYVDGKSFNGDFNPNQYYAPSAESRTTVLTFSPEVYDILAQKGLIIHGEGIMLTRAVLVNTTTGITETIVEQPNDAPVYDLSGRRVTHPQRGIYIRRGKKFVVSTTANSR